MSEIGPSSLQVSPSAKGNVFCSSLSPHHNCSCGPHDSNISLTGPLFSIPERVGSELTTEASQQLLLQSITHRDYSENPFQNANLTMPTLSHKTLYASPVPSVLFNLFNLLPVPSLSGTHLPKLPHPPSTSATWDSSLVPDPSLCLDALSLLLFLPSSPLPLPSVIVLRLPTESEWSAPSQALPCLVHPLSRALPTFFLMPLSPTTL